MSLIVVMNCNTSAAMTLRMGIQAQSHARPGTKILALNPTWGPDSAEGYYDSFITAAAVLDRLHSIPEETAAVVMAGFGEHGREGAREMLDVPVVDVTEAAATFALFLGPQFGVVTTLSRARAQIRDSLRVAGLWERCASVEAADVGVLELELKPDAAFDSMCAAGQRAVDRGAEVLVLGCAGMTGLDAALSDKLGVPVVDSVTAAVAQAESLIALGLNTSRSLTYAHPRTKRRDGWPITSQENHS